MSQALHDLMQLDADINFVDTDNVYSAREPEEIVGKARKRRRDEVVLATKFCMPMGTGPNRGGGSRRWIVVLLRQPDRRSADRVAGSQFGVIRHRAAPYSILVRGIEQDVLPTTQRYGMGTLTYSPLAGGWLSGKWRRDTVPTPTSAARPSARFDMSSTANQNKLEAVDALARVADEAGVPLIELAIAFVINHPAVTSAIVGPPHHGPTGVAAAGRACDAVG